MNIISQKEKLIERFKLLPKDFTFDEMVKLLGYYGYTLNNGGKSSGSGIHFVKDGISEEISFHKPHPSNICKHYVLKNVMEKLYKEGLL